MTNIRVFLLVLLLSPGHGAWADDELKAKLSRALERVLPDIEVTSVSESPVPGLYEVMLGPSLLYVSEDGRFVVKGDIFDLKSLDNISQKRRAAARVESFASLAQDGMIEFAPPAGKTQHTIYVYTDIDCGYCRKLHLEVAKLNEAGIAVRYLAYPRTGIGSESYDKAVAVWCSADRRKAMTASKAGQTVEAAACPNPVANHWRMGEAMGVRGTPAVYSETGEPLGGYIPSQELIRILNGHKG